MARAGAGAIGDYVGCSFTSVGTGRFIPSQGADPFIGEVGKLEEVAEERIEVVLPGPSADESTEGNVSVPSVRRASV